jgi:hypothetical protein
MKAHVNAVQALSFRYLLWVSPFMVGDESEAAKHCADLLTSGQERERFKNLSPQRPETRRIVGELMERLVRDRYWVGFYTAHRDTIIRGEFKPVLELGHIPLIHPFPTARLSVEVGGSLQIRTPS